MGCGASAQWLAWALSALAAGLVVWALVQAKRRGIEGQRSLAGALVLVAAHPGIWMEPGLYDCGRGLLVRSALFTGMVGLIAAWTLLRPPGPPAEEPEQ